MSYGLTRSDRVAHSNLSVPCPIDTNVMPIWQKTVMCYSRYKSPCLHTVLSDDVFRFQLVFEIVSKLNGKDLGSSSSKKCKLDVK